MTTSSCTIRRLVLLPADLLHISFIEGLLSLHFLSNYYWHSVLFPRLMVSPDILVQPRTETVIFVYGFQRWRLPRANSCIGEHPGSSLRDYIFLSLVWSIESFFSGPLLLDIMRFYSWSPNDTCCSPANISFVLFFLWRTVRKGSPCWPMAFPWWPLVPAGLSQWDFPSKHMLWSFPMCTWLRLCFYC